MAKMIQIESTLLEEELKKRNLNKRDVSRKLGHGPGYISDALNRRRISESASLVLKIYYDIDPESYTRKEPQKQKAETTPELENVGGGNGLDYNRLHKIIYSAVYMALKRIDRERKEN